MGQRIWTFFIISCSVSLDSWSDPQDLGFQPPATFCQLPPQTLPSPRPNQWGWGEGRWRWGCLPLAAQTGLISDCVTRTTCSWPQLGSSLGLEFPLASFLSSQIPSLSFKAHTAQRQLGQEFLQPVGLTGSFPCAPEACPVQPWGPVSPRKAQAKRA